MLGFLGGAPSRRAFLRGAAAASAAALAAACGVTPRRRTGDGPPEHVLLCRVVYTLDDARPLARAVAVRDGRILAVGSHAEMLALRGTTTVVHDARDLVLLPGFVDPHMHSTFASLRPWLDVGPFTTPDMAEAAASLRARVAACGPGEWVQAKMLDPSIMPGATFDRRVLDALAPDVPVFVLESNGHVAYANTRAFERAGVTRDTPDPPQARFVRDADGELTGRLEETPAFQPFVACMPAPGPDELQALVRADLDEAASRGCTALHECGIGALFGEGDLHLLDAVMASDPPVRYAGQLVATHFDRWDELGLRPGPRAPRFRLTGIKSWADGSTQGRTGFLREPYLGGDDRGALNDEPARIAALIRRAHEGDWAIGVHANGDAAIDVVLDGFEATFEDLPRGELRHRIEHCSLLHDEQIARMAASGISPSFLIGHVHYWGRAFRDRLLGPARAERLDPCASALAGGLRISLHSDYNVTPIDPLRCIENAVVRDMREGGGVLAPAERLLPLQAIRAMTLDAAWQCGLDDVCGSLVVGKAADFVLLGDDPTEIEPDRIGSIGVHSTWLDGEVRFEA